MWLHSGLLCREGESDTAAKSQLLVTVVARCGHDAKKKTKIKKFQTNADPNTIVREGMTKKEKILNPNW